MNEISFERLYLAKDCKNRDIFVDKCPLIQHHIDGIRFLYRALKKKTPAVILSDPVDTRVDTALFVSAVLPTLNKPLLIICKEGVDEIWRRCFQQWTDVYDDIAVELKNPFIKKKIIINPYYSASEFARRDWSMLVVDDDHIPTDIRKSSFKADFKVWITASAIQEDLTMLSSFYTWAYQKKDKNKFIAEKFIADKNDLKDVLLKRVMLDAFLDDIVFTRDSNVQPFTKKQESTRKIETRTKGKKDATGTKIKRSKRKCDIDIADNENVQSKVTRIAESTDKLTESTDILRQDTKDYKIGWAAEVTSHNEVIQDNSQSDDEIVISRGKKSRMKWDSEDSDNEKPTDKHIDKFEDKKEPELNISDESKVLRWDSGTDTENEIESQVKIKNIVDDEARENNTTILVDNEMELINDMNLAENEINNKSNHVESEDIFLTNPNEMIVKDIIYETQDKPASTSTSKENGPDNCKNAENLNLSKFELKMKELEELTFKKYKGSFLDKIF